MGYAVQKTPGSIVGTWAPTWAGFSADPAGTGHYILIGKMCFVWFGATGAGTSSSTGASLKTMTLPFTAASGIGQNIAIERIVNNGANQSAPGLGVIALSSNIMTVYRDGTLATAWTASGNCFWNFFGVYEIA